MANKQVLWILTGIHSNEIPKYYNEQQEHMHAIQATVKRTAILPQCKSESKTARPEKTKISSLWNRWWEKLIHTHEIDLGEERKSKQKMFRIKLPITIHCRIT